MKTIEIITNNDVSAEEISCLEKISIDSGLKDTNINNNGGKRGIAADFPPELLILIKGAGFGISSGFFGAIGVDLWNKIKRFVLNSFRYYEKENGRQEFYNAQICIDIKENNESKIQINFPNRNFNKSLESIDDFIKENKFEKYSSLKFVDNKWITTKDKFKNQETLYKEFMSK